MIPKTKVFVVTERPATMLFTILFAIMTVCSGLPVDSSTWQKTTRYLVQMKKPFTLESLCKEDDKVKSFSHVRAGIKSIISFGQFEGIVGDFATEVVQRLTDNPLIEKITPDIIVKAVDYTTQYDAPAHLVRLSQEGPVEREDTEYCYDDDNLGEDVNVYILDTGVFVEHPEFEGRATMGPNFSDDLKHIDYVGHGTHVAGIIGSKKYGVAKRANLISVKTLDKHGQGTLSSVIAGLEYAVHHRADSGLPGVANLSLGASRSTILDAAVEAATDSGLVVVAAAGNSNLDACRTSPAGSSSALTVGAIDGSKDKIASFSNWGRCVDIFAPGVGVVSLSNNPFDYGVVEKMSGTSMASPVVAGIATTLLGSGVAPDNIRGELRRLAVSGAIPRTSMLLRPGSPNLISIMGACGSTESLVRPNGTATTTLSIG